MGGNISIIVRLRNLTNSDVVSIVAFDTDNFDFGSFLCPGKLYNGVGIKIPSNGCVEHTIELNAMASNCPCAFKFRFANGLEDVFKLNLRHAYDMTEPNFRHIKQSHNIIFHKPCSKLIEIIFKNTTQQIENREAERLNSIGSDLLAARNYEAALMTFSEAAQMAHELETKLSIRRNQERIDRIKDKQIDNLARSLNDEGYVFLTKNQFQLALKKLEEALNIATDPETINIIMNNCEIAHQTKIHQDMKKLNQEGLLLKTNGDAAGAIQKFDEALSLLKDADPELIKSIKRNKSDTLIQQAKIIIEQASLIEIFISKTSETIDKYSSAKALLERIENPNAAIESMIRAINCKIKGLKYLAFARQLEKEEVSSRYENAREQYEEARRKFMEGEDIEEMLISFKPNLDSVEKAIRNISKIISSLPNDLGNASDKRSVCV